MKILEKIKALKNEGKSPDKIEKALLSEKLGKIVISHGGYQFIGDLALSHLVVEAHNPGFINWMIKHPNANVVHHKDRDITNNTYLNLQVMSQSDHSRMHRTDPKFIEAEKARNKKHSEWFTDPANAKAIEARNKKISGSLVTYNANLANVEAVETKSKAMSETKRKNWPDLSTFKKLFTIREYTEASRVGYGTALYRLKKLLNEGLITCETELVGKRWQNVYRRIE